MDVVVTVAVSLVNMLTPGQGSACAATGRGRLPAAPRRCLAAADDITLAEATDLRRFAMAFRVVFSAVAAGDVDAAARQVNELLAATGAHPQLDRHDGEPWHLHFHGTKEDAAIGWAAGCATGLAVVLGSELHGRIGVCTAPRCDRVYVDTSRNGTRRCCSTTCQNRVKAAGFRARQATVG
jgi:predicted RNA-binding Zn ribbon-like protein